MLTLWGEPESMKWLAGIHNMNQRLMEKRWWWPDYGRLCYRCVTTMIMKCIAIANRLLIQISEARVRNNNLFQWPFLFLLVLAFLFVCYVCHVPFFLLFLILLLLLFLFPFVRYKVLCDGYGAIHFFICDIILITEQKYSMEFEQQIWIYK